MNHGQLLQRAIAPLARCHVCQRAASSPSGVCVSCMELLENALASLPPPTGSSFWLGWYAGPWLRLVHALKFRGERRLAAYLGGLLAARCAAGTWSPTTVCHVPASRQRVEQRGYDQAELLAQHVAAELHVDHVGLLVRAPAARQGPTAAPLSGSRVPTARQAHLGRAARAVNADAAFEARYAPGRRVLLVDDVMTTGATAAACHAALLAAGAAEVRTVVIARTSAGRRVA